jgi:hypothetical protein
MPTGRGTGVRGLRMERSLAIGAAERWTTPMRSVCVAVALMVVWMTAGIAHAAPEGEGASAAFIAPVMPPDLGWSEALAKEVTAALAGYPTDPVSAHLTWAGLLGKEKDPPTATQKAWLQKAAEASKPDALALLQRDLRAAVAANDLLGASIAVVVGGKVQKDWPDGDDKNALGLTKVRVLGGAEIVKPVWEVSGVSGSWVEGSYTESFYPNQTTISPAAGFHLLRVKGTVRNVSEGSDAPYVLWSGSELQRAVAKVFAEPDTPGSTKRLAMGGFFWAATPGGDLVSCGFVPEACSALRGKIGLKVDGKPLPLGSFIKHDESFALDVLFSVPTGIEGFRLLAFGAAPVPIPIVPVK